MSKNVCDTSQSGQQDSQLTVNLESESPMQSANKVALENSKQMVTVIQLVDKLRHFTAFKQYADAQKIAEKLIIEARMLRNTFILLDEESNDRKDG